MRLQAAMLVFSLSTGASSLAQAPAVSAGSAAQADAQAAGERMRHAEASLEQGDYKGAEADLQVLARARPNDARVQYDLGFTEEHNAEEAAAAQAYAAALAADPRMPEAQAALGLLEARGGQTGPAHEHLGAAAKNPGAPPPLRAKALRALARLDEATDAGAARDEMLQAAQLTGEQPGDAEFTAGLAARAGDGTGAEAAYRRVLAKTPGDIDATVGLAAQLTRIGKLAEADALLSPALNSHPDDPRLATQLAAVFAAEGKNPEAVALLVRLRTSDPAMAADPAITRLLAHLELVSGNAAAAEPLYRSLVAARPDDPALLDDFGSALVRQNKFPEAEAVLSRAVAEREAFHDDAAWGEAAGHLAFAASRNGHPEVALQALHARATVLPNSPASLFLEATSYDALHQYKRAQTSYRAFLLAAKGKLPDEEFEARHRLVALQHER